MTSPDLATKKSVSKRRDSTTVHTNRTIMSAEVAAVMAHAAPGGYNNSLEANITGKATKVNEERTTSLLRKLYGFSPDKPDFNCFQHFWTAVDFQNHALLTFVYAIGRDTLLAQSITTIAATSVGQKISGEAFFSAIAKTYPDKYSPATLRSAGSNIISSWKQAGFVEGRRNLLRVQRTIPPAIVAFALALGYLNGARGAALFQTIWVEALLLREGEVTDLVHRASLAGWLHYQQTGGIVVIHFDQLFQKLDLNGGN